METRIFFDFRLVFWCAWILILLKDTPAKADRGSLDITVHPGVLYEGDRVQMTCINSVNRSYMPDTQRCSLGWSRDVMASHSSYIPPEKREARTEADGMGWPLNTTLILLSMERSMDGRYVCTLTCRHVRLVRKVFIEMAEDEISDVNVPNAGLFIGMAVFVSLTACGTGLYLRDALKASRGRRRLPPNRIGSADEQESDQRNPADWNPAPRYSIVIASGNLYPPPHRENSSIFIVPVSPPKYADAIKSLEENGLSFSFEHLQPMPPCYQDVMGSCTAAGAHAGQLGRISLATTNTYT